MVRLQQSMKKKEKFVESRPKQHRDCLTERDLPTVPQSSHVVGRRGHGGVALQWEGDLNGLPAQYHKSAFLYGIISWKIIKQVSPVHCEAAVMTQ